jgi:Ca2+/Na+ antiporter
MAKAKKEEKNSKSRVKISLMKTLLILLGADLILLLAPGIGLLNSAFYIGDMISWSAVIIGMILLALGFNGVFRKVKE